MAQSSFNMRVFPLAPLMHGAAIWTALMGLLGGQTLVLDPMRGGFDAQAIWDRVERQNVNILQIVGDAMALPLLEALIRYPGRWDFSKLINFGSGGAVFSAHLKDAIRERIPHVMITDGMGTSETGYSGMGEDPSKGGFMRLMANDMQQVIIDGRIAAVGETGLLARSGYIARGYYNDPEKTAEVFQTIDGKLWALSGDQACLDADGRITVLGRSSTCINTGGEKVYPEEVEGVLRAHPSIHDVAVLGMPDPKWGQKVCALISLSQGVAEPDFADVKEFCRKHLAGYKLPKTVKIVPQIQRSPAGKQDYKWVKSVFPDMT